MVRRRAYGAVAAALVLGITGGIPAAATAADARPAFDWLTREPVTLFDLGMLRLRQEMVEAAAWLVGAGHARGEPLAGAFYQWRQHQIVAYVTVHERFADPTETGCRAMFQRLRERLFRDTPGGIRSAEIYLETLFAHPGFGNYGNPRHIGRELVELVQVEVTILPPPPVTAGGDRIRCAGRLDTPAEELAMTGG